MRQNRARPDVAQVRIWHACQKRAYGKLGPDLAHLIEADEMSRA
jgi:hypothetical protein